MPCARFATSRRLANQHLALIMRPVVLIQAIIVSIGLRSPTETQQIEITRFLFQSASETLRPLRDDQRAGAALGEDFEQHRMGRLAVEDDNALHAGLDGVDAGFDLRDHAAGNRAVGDQRVRL